MLFRRCGVLVLMLMVVTGCSSAPASVPAAASEPAGPVDVVAHRGGKPENTLSAFKAALADAEVGAIELDVQVSKDGELFIMHDKTLDRTTDGKGPIDGLTAAEIRQLKTPKGGTEPVPTLDDVMALLAAAPGKRAFVEIKEPTPADTAAKVVAVLKKHNVADRCVVTSFDRTLLDATRKVDPSQAIGFISKSWGNLENSYESPYLLITFGEITKEKVAAAHKAGRKVYAWTVNDKPIMQNFKAMGLDGIISDEYRLLAETVR